MKRISLQKTASTLAALGVVYGLSSCDTLNKTYAVYADQMSPVRDDTVHVETGSGGMADVPVAMPDLPPAGSPTHDAKPTTGSRQNAPDLSPATKPTTKPTAKPVPKPVAKPEPKPVARQNAPDLQPATKPTAKPAAQPTAKPVPRYGPNAITITLKKGDTLVGIARRYGVSMANLYKANDLRPDTRLRSGQQLIIPKRNFLRRMLRLPWITDPEPAKPAPAPRKSTATPAKRTAASRTYTLKPGDTLTGVAAKHRVPLAKLIKANNLQAAEINKLRVGRVLQIPAS